MDRLNQYKGRNGAPQSHEMEEVNIAEPPSKGSFLAEISDLQDSISKYNSNIQIISSLHTRSLSALPSGSEDTSELDQLTSDNEELCKSIKDRIRKLTDDPQLLAGLSPAELQIRKNQVRHIRDKFIEALQRYQKVEQDFRSRSQQRVERQYKIVKPDATPEEVKQVIQQGNSQVFAEALSNAQYATGREAFYEVQKRHEELQKMERTLGELAQMYNDMAYIVEQQQEIFENIEKTTLEVHGNTKQGLEQTEKATFWARQYRSKRKICAFVTIILIIAIVIGVAVGICENTSLCSKKSSSSSSNNTRRDIDVDAFRWSAKRRGLGWQEDNW